jgi:signal recognition particle receptor subunit beta
MDEIKVAVLGKQNPSKTELIKNLSKNAANVEFKGMSSGIDIGYTVANGRRVYLFGGSSEEKEKFFEEVLPAGIDLGIIVVDSSKGISPEDKELIDEVKEHNMPCQLLDFLSKMA